MNPEHTYQALRPHYAAFLMLERGLSANTREAYLRDVDRLAQYLEESGIEPAEATADDLHSFIFALHDLGIAPRSQARIVSGVRSFYRYMEIEGITAKNPSQLLEGPKLCFPMVVAKGTLGEG